MLTKEQQETRKKSRAPLKEHLERNPECCKCGLNASEVHHIVPIKYDGTNDDENLASLCSFCHQEYTIWEKLWETKYGAERFEELFEMFCSAPSLKFIAIWHLYEDLKSLRSDFAMPFEDMKEFELFCNRSIAEHRARPK